MNKAIFLDRDGVLNRDNADYTYSLDNFELLPGLFDALNVFQDKGFLLIVISNQAGIARKIYALEDVKKVHDYMLEKFRENGISITEIYICPHYHEIGSCICRKPDSLLLEKAIARFKIDPRQSYFIGDRDRDMEAAQKVGVKGIKVESDVDLRTVMHLIE